MHPLLRTLDLTAGAGTGSSIHDLHPIQQAAAARSRGIPFLFSLGLTPLLIYGLAVSLISPTSARAVRGAIDQATRSVSLLLQEPAEQAHPTAPVRNLVGPQEPGGEGHREGTSTLDPRLAGIQATTLSMPSDAIDPDELGTSPRAELAFLSLNPALPARAGGNGLARGTGRDAALGVGGLIRPPVPVPVPDFRLIPTRQIQLSYQMAPGEEYLMTQLPQVRILIGEDGVPFKATLISGPPKLRGKALRAALGWRFEPLGPHGLKAPLALTITFRRGH